MKTIVCAALRNRSYFSILDSTLSPEEIVDAAAAAGMPAAGPIDHGTLAGAVRFYQRARAVGVRPVIGSEIRTPGRHRLMLLVENAAGYRNLCRLLSEYPGIRPDRASSDPAPALATDKLQAHRNGLIALFEAATESAEDERCRFEFALGDILFPDFPTGGEPPSAMLRRLANDGMRRRYGPKPRAEVRARLERELSVIEEVGYAEYFLIFAEIVRWANEQGIASLARGSAAGSLVCYVLQISNVCPFRFGLCFERFLNKERMQFSKLADIDLDLPWDRRDEVVAHVFERYGEERVAMIGAVNTFRGRAAVASAPECRGLPYREEPYRSVLRMAGRLNGIPRHFMMHPCGLVVAPRPIRDLTPVFESAKGVPTTHYAMDEIEDLGLLKMDLLGQAGLSVLRDAIANVRDNRGVEIDPEALDGHDPLTWDSIATGKARGVFHIESPAMTGLLQMTSCRDVDCLTAVESSIRPGAANEGKKRAFARRHQGLEPVEYAHPSLEPLLADTYGLLAYEEHILLVANGFAGMPWGRADMLRRALVKNKDRELIGRLGQEFRDLARRRGRTLPETERVWKQLEEFAGYMFNKAHSAAYAVEAYRGAWIKARYPVEFLAAVLSNRRGFYSPMVYVLEALRAGARFLAPDVNSSGERYVVKGRTIRLPLDQVKGLTAATCRRILNSRPFHDARTSIAPPSRVMTNGLRC